MEFKQLQSFAAVVKFKSFSNAADFLGFSQPTVSTHIRLLEEELGTKLIIRTTKDFEITPKGYDLYKYANQVFNLQDVMLRSWKESESLPVSIAASTIPATYILPRITSEFMSSYPDFTMSVNQASSFDIINGVSEGRYDLGVICTNRRLAFGSNNLCKFVPFCREHIIVITPPYEYYKKALENRYVDADFIIKQPIIIRGESSKIPDPIFKKLGINDNSLNVVAAVGNYEAMKKMVANGMGIAVISEFAVSDYIREGLVLKGEIQGFKHDGEMQIVHNAQMEPGSLAKKFIDFCRKVNITPNFLIK